MSVDTDYSDHMAHNRSCFRFAPVGAVLPALVLSSPFVASLGATVGLVGWIFLASDSTGRPKSCTHSKNKIRS